MDEAEKYKQRLEAIAEKRRLLEEQEKAKREMEDERIRLQQLKRKSLRDQWLMEGPPLSPTSLDAPRSPLWGPQAKEIETNIDKLESKMQQLTEAEEKLKDVMEDGQIQKTVGVEETPTGEESPKLDKVTYTNGTEEMEGDVSHVASVDVPPTINGLTEETKVVQVVSVDNNVHNSDDDEEEDGTMVIRAECIMIIDEGDEMAEETTKENRCSVEGVTLIPEETQKTVTEFEQSEEKVPNGVEEDKHEEATAAQLLSNTEERAALAPVPVYATTQPCITTTLQTEVENEDTSEEERIEVSSRAKGNVTVEFQEVPLSELPDKTPKAEQDPLLFEIKAKDAELATSSYQTETPNRDQAETKTSKRKTCQCCSVM